MSLAGRNYTQKLAEVKEDNSSAPELFDFVLDDDLSLPSQPRHASSPFLDTDSEICSEYGTTDSFASPASLPFDFDITDSETLTTTADQSPQISNFLEDIHICGSPDMSTTTFPLSQSMAVQTLGSASMATLISSTQAPQSLLGLGSSSAPSTTLYQQPFQFQQTQSFPQYNYWTSHPLIQSLQSSLGHSWGAATNPEPSDVASFYSMNSFYPPTLAAGTQSPALDGLSNSTLSAALSSYYPLRQSSLAVNNAIALTTPCTDPAQASPAATVSRGSNPVVLSMPASSSPSFSSSSTAWHSFTSPLPIPATVPTTVPGTFTSFPSSSSSSVSSSSSSVSSSSSPSSSSSSSPTPMKTKGKTVRTRVSKSVPRSGTALSNNRKTLYKCEICSLELTRPSNLKVHREIHLGTREHCCKVCHHTFRLVADLMRHERIHSGEKPYPCVICTNGESFSRVDALRRHYENQHKGDSRVPIKKTRRACGQKKPFKEEEDS